VDNRTNISGAIARSRRMRAAMRRRRQRLALAACLAAAAGVPLSLSFVGVTGNDVVHAAVSGANSVADLFDKRSPGERTAAQLTKTKHAKRPSSAVAPPDRQPMASPMARKHDFDDVAHLLVGAPPMADIAPPVEHASADIPTIAGLIGSNPDVTGTLSGGGGGGGGVGGGSGGGGSPSFPTSEPRQPLTPVAPVPEPGTWATMLLGFAMLGWRMRRRPSKRCARKPAA
jgi:PEP-CTERM motif